MDLLVKQRFLTLRAEFDVTNTAGEPLYYVVGRSFSLADKFTITDTNGQDCLMIEQQFLSWHRKYHIIKDGKVIATVNQDWTMFKDKFYIEDLGWEIEGDFIDHEYQIMEGRNLIARVSRELFTLSDRYALHIRQEEHADLILAISIIIDSTIAQSS